MFFLDIFNGNIVTIFKYFSIFIFCFLFLKYFLYKKILQLSIYLHEEIEKIDNTLESILFLFFCMIIGVLSSCVITTFVHFIYLFFVIFVLYNIMNNFIYPLTIIVFQLIGSICLESNHAILFSIFDLLEFLTMLFFFKKGTLNRFMMDIKFIFSLILAVLIICINAIEIYAQFKLNYNNDVKIPIISTFGGPLWSEILKIINTKYSHFYINNFSEVLIFFKKTIVLNTIRYYYFSRMIIWLFARNDLYNEHPRVIYYILSIILLVFLSFSIYYQYFFLSIMFFNLSFPFFIALSNFGYYKILNINNLALFYFTFNGFDSVSSLLILFFIAILDPVFNFFKKQ